MNNLEYRIQTQKNLILTFQENIEFARQRLELPRTHQTNWIASIFENEEGIKGAREILAKLLK